MGKYNYIVFYEFENKIGAGAGRCDIARNTLIKNIEDVIEIEIVIKNKWNLKNVVITNIQRFPI